MDQKGQQVKLAQTTDYQMVEITILYFTRRTKTWLESSRIDIDEVPWLKISRKLKRFAEKSVYDVISVFIK